MQNIAIDIALLPSNEMTNMAIQANSQLNKKSSQELVLSKDTCLPHITLAMGCVNEKNITTIKSILQDIVDTVFPQQLKVTGVYIETSYDGRKTSLYCIEKTDEIQKLHEEIMNRLSPYFSYDVTEDMLFTPPPIHEKTLLWIKNYPTQSSFDNFIPHITIGFGVAAALNRPVDCAPLKLAICHLGNHCTCRKVLALIDPKQGH